MDINAAEISRVIKDQIANFGNDAEVSEVGQVLSVGDGIARVVGGRRPGAARILPLRLGRKLHLASEVLT